MKHLILELIYALDSDNIEKKIIFRKENNLS